MTDLLDWFTPLIEPLQTVAIKYSLVTAFALVGGTVWISYFLSARLPHGRLHGSAIAILAGLMMAYVGVSLPLFWLGLLLILVFSFWLGWFPPAGQEGLRSLILPSITLGLVSAGVISRLTRSSLVEVLVEDYVRTARSKGLVEQGLSSFFQVLLHLKLKLEHIR